MDQDNPFLVGMTLLSEAQEMAGQDIIEATAKAYQALHVFETVPTRRGMGMARLLLGQYALFAAELAEARDHLIIARDLFAEIPLLDLEAKAHQILAEVYTRFDDYDSARTELEKALSILEIGGELDDLAEIHRRLGSLERRCGNIEEAVTYYAQAVAEYSALDDEVGLAGVSLSFGNTLAVVGQDDDAMEAYNTAMELFAGVGDRLGQANAERFYAAAASRRGLTDVADRYFRKALEGYIEVGDVLGESYVRQYLGQMAVEAGDTSQARDELQKAVELFSRTSDPINLVKATNALAESYASEGDELGRLHAMSWGVSEARQAARWAVSAAHRDEANHLIADLEAEALALAVKLGEGAVAGQVIEGGVAGLVGLLPILLREPASADEKTEALRQQVHHLAGRLESATGDADEPHGTSANEDRFGSKDSPDDDTQTDGPPTRSHTATAARADVIGELEQLLGPRAREIIAPETKDYGHVLTQASSDRTVVQYCCPGGLNGGQPLYTVWSAPNHAPRVTCAVMSEEVAERLRLLTGVRLLESSGAGDAAPPEEATMARGLGLVGDEQDMAKARQIARRTYELWTVLDRSPRADSVVAQVAAVLFPPDLVNHLVQSGESELPARLLIIPGPRLWNLPWSGLAVDASGRRLVDIARVSLAASLSSLRAKEGTDATIRAVDAWIPMPGPGVVKGSDVERTMVSAMFGPRSLAGSPTSFLASLGDADAAIMSVHGEAAVGLAHGLFLAPGHTLTAADLIGLDLPHVLIIGACWSSRVDPEAEPFALPLIAHARGADEIIGGVYPLPDMSPFPTARLLAQLYPALLGTDPATALWLAQHEAHAAGAAPHTWAGVIHTTAAMT